MLRGYFQSGSNVFARSTPDASAPASRPSFARTAGKALRHPARALRRLILWARLASRDPVRERRRLLEFLTREFEVDAAALQQEYAASDFHSWYQKRRAELASFSGPYRLGSTEAFGCEALYLLVRAARPRTVIETGVLYGASSAHILAALALNDRGTLHSIELGRSPREPTHDFLVPVHLRQRWNLVIGDSRQVLPALLSRLGGADLFHHDSLHTFEHMTWEYQTAFAHLTPGGVLSSHDVLTVDRLHRVFQKNAFVAFCETRAARWSTFQNIGIALTHPGETPRRGLRA
jgi:predicted O-methyltransferase YrrM